MQTIDKQLARINLEADENRAAFWVSLTSFLEFSYELSEELDDLVANYELDSHRSSFSFARPLNSKNQPVPF